MEDPRMAAKRLLMGQFRETLRLKLEVGLTHLEIARSCSVGLGTITEYLRRAEAAGVGWPLAAELDDAALEVKVFSGPTGPDVPRPLPDFAWIHRELRRPGATLQVAWHEYVETHPSGYRYSQFCERYKRWARKLNPSMRQGAPRRRERFVDYSGKKL
jgi:transposase